MSLKKIDDVIKKINKLKKPLLWKEGGTDNSPIDSLIVSTAIRNEIILATKDWRTAYKHINTEKEPGGVFKLIEGVKILIAPKNHMSDNDIFRKFSKEYKLFVKKSLNIIEQEIDIISLSSDEIVYLAKGFPEILITLEKGIFLKDSLKEKLLTELKNSFNVFYNNIYDTEKSLEIIKVSKLTPLGLVREYPEPQKDFFKERNFRVLQYALLAKIDILTDNEKNNPLLFLNIFTNLNRVEKFDRDLTVSQKQTLIEKTNTLLQLNIDAICFGFIDLNLVRKNNEYFEKIIQNESHITYDTSFRNFLSYLNKEPVGEEITKISILNNMSLYFQASSLYYWKILPGNITSILMSLLKNIKVDKGGSKPTLEHTTSGQVTGDLFIEQETNTAFLNYIPLLAKILKTNNEIDEKKILHRILKTLVMNFHTLSSENKKSEYTWMIRNFSDDQKYIVFCTILAKFNSEIINNEIEILIDLYINDKVKNQSGGKLDLNYVIYLSKDSKKVFDLRNEINKSNETVNMFISSDIINTEKKNKYINDNLKKIAEYLNSLIVTEKMEVFFYQLSKTNLKTLGTISLRTLIEDFERTNREDEQLFLNTNLDTDEEILQTFILSNNKNIVKEFSNISKYEKLNKLSLYMKNETKDNSIDLEDTLTHECISILTDHHYSLSHLVYCMSYKFLAESSFRFEKDLKAFVNDHNNKNGFEYISNKIILGFLREWINTASREGYLIEQMQERKDETLAKELEIVLTKEAQRPKVISRKKI